MVRHALISMVLLLSCSSFLSSGAQAKLIELKATFDTSVLPKKTKPFQLHVDHAAIVYPEDPRKMLHGTGKLVNLQGETGGTLLQGRVEEVPKLTTITTIERGVGAKFHLDLSALIPKIAPDLTRQLNAQLGDVGKALTARVEKEEPEMKKQLQALQALNDPKNAPVIPAAVQQNPKMPLTGKSMLPNGGKVDLDGMKPRQGPVSIPAPFGDGGRSRAALLQGGGGAGGMIAMMPADNGGTVGKIVFPAVNGKLRIPETRTQPKLAIPDVNATLRRGRPLYPPVDANVNAKLGFPNVNAKLGVPQAYPDLEAMAASAKRLPPNAMPNLADDNVAAELSGEKAILWDQWHKTFATVAGAAILKAVRSAGNPKGNDTLSVVVYPDQRIDVSINKPSTNRAFDSVILSAYKSLNGNKALAYPAGSLRSRVSFLVDHKNTGDGVAANVHSQTSRGDKEIIRPAHR